ncbi:MAG: hypothetical protein GXP29_02005 [Planctomycetes bacterium]|nr:hypothetical protein [Planctomycetota bacterium]
MNYVRAITIVGIILLGLPACSQNTQSMTPRSVGLLPDSTILPTRDCGDLFLVTAQINGQDGFNLLLDTGAAGLSLSKNAANRLWPNRSARHVDELRIGEFTASDFGAAVSNLSAASAVLGEPIDGVLGLRIFMGVLMTYDFPNRTVILEHGSLDAFGEGVVRYSGVRPFLPFETGVLRREFLLDTGYTGTIGVPSLEGMPIDGEPVVSSFGASTRGTFLAKSVRLRTDATFGPIRFSRPIINTRNKETSIIGSQILNRFVLTFDQEQKLVRFGGPIHEAIEMDPVRAHGFLVAPKEGKFRVAHIIPNSPADIAGIEIDDLVEAINGQPLEIDCKSRNAKPTKQKTPTHSTITFSRDGKQWDAQLRYVEYLP